MFFMKMTPVLNRVLAWGHAARSTALRAPRTSHTVLMGKLRAETTDF
jgi:hypothetical protein